LDISQVDWQTASSTVRVYPVSARDDLLKMPSESYDRVMRINLRGPFFPHPGGRTADDRHEITPLLRYHHDLVDQCRIRLDCPRGEYCVSKTRFVHDGSAFS
jgi:hypothetical protein